MKRAIIIALSIAVAGPAFAAGKSCEELKSEIQAKIEANKVKAFTLDVVEADKAGDAKVVGSCEAGSKKIVYTRRN